MIPTLIIGDAEIYQGNNLEVLPTLPDNSVDSIVCDPPYELGFMNKGWDSSGIAYSVELWQECFRVLKPGGHLLAFSASRTYHRMTVAIEDAGFEIRDMIAWISNKTFPKSHNISKAIDKLQGGKVKVGKAFNVAGEYGGRNLRTNTTNEADEMRHTADTDDAKQWDGWGTALKPTVEPIVLARKPIQGTVAQNVLEHGVGGLNIDATRVGTDVITITNGKGFAGSFEGGVNNNGGSQHVGRWPANLLIDETTAELLDEQSGLVKGGVWNNTAGARHFSNNGKPTDYVSKGSDKTIGGVSRFFYVARASKSDRNEGLDIINNHPTVKPTSLMQYLIRLITPDNGVVLDPFTGSGSTGKAAILEGKRFIGIELTAEYLPIIEGRLQHALETMNTKGDDLFE